jgi:RNA polymerase sigma factor (sigma-70 family)
MARSGFMDQQPERLKIGSQLRSPQEGTDLPRLLEQEVPALELTLRTYVWRAGLATGEALRDATLNLLSEVIQTALEQAAHYDRSRELRPWLLGIAANLIKRQQVERAKRSRREPLVGDLWDETPETPGETALLARLAALSTPSPEEAVEAQEQVEALLRLVSVGDQQVLRLAILEDYDGEHLARQLGITPVAARVRLHRALQRLRGAWERQQDWKAREQA